MSHERTTRKLTPVELRPESDDELRTNYGKNHIESRTNQGRARGKTKNASRHETTAADVERVTIWNLVDRQNGQKPRFERVTLW